MAVIFMKSSDILTCCSLSGTPVAAREGGCAPIFTFCAGLLCMLRHGLGSYCTMSLGSGFSLTRLVAVFAFTVTVRCSMALEQLQVANVVLFKFGCPVRGGSWQ